MYNVNYSQSDILPGANIAKDSLKSLFSSLPAHRVPKNFSLHRDVQMSLKNKLAFYKGNRIQNFEVSKA